MQLYVVPVTEISVPGNRQRKLFDAKQLSDLAASIADNGLIHPIVVRRDEDAQLILVAGERRLRALEYVWNYGQEVRCGTRTVPEGYVPCNFLGEIDPVDAFEIELEENIRRTDLDWKERATATSQLYELRKQQAIRDGRPEPTVGDIAAEIAGVPADTPSSDLGSYNEVRTDIILARNLDNPVVAKATSRKEAFKLLRRSEERQRNEQIGRALGATFTGNEHRLYIGDCTTIMATLPDGSFDVLLTDPPYGIDAQDFGDSDGKAASHCYDDSPERFGELAAVFAKESFRLCRPDSHAYVFCDIDWFSWLKGQMSIAGWRCFRTPLIWVNPSAVRAPWPDMGPQRKWQMILYAVKGNRNVTKVYPDVITFPSDTNLGHQAQKPTGLYEDLLRRSVRPGDSVLDPFCGTGPIFPASHSFKARATGIEIDPAAAGIASKRIEGLK